MVLARAAITATVRPPVRITVGVIVSLALLAATAPEAAAADHEPQAVEYRPPVDAMVIDGFRPPTTPYGPGNRGIDYATTEEQPVRAAADGEVTFAGRIGASASAVHVTVLHRDGIRTTYSFLATATVRRGDHVHQGDTLGTTGPPTTALHFGARAPNDVYLNPLVLLGQTGDSRQHAYLVADPHPTEPLTEAQERHLVLEAIRGLIDRVRQLPHQLADRALDDAQRKIDLARVLVDDAADLSIPIPIQLALDALRWQRVQATCTPPHTPAPEPTARRIVILVGGLGSATGDAAVLDTDTEALGYAPEDVHQFSYRASGEPYGPSDTQGDIAEQGKRLAAVIQATQRQHPAIPVDVIAHSQGGLVARSAITTHHAAPATVVTLATPHQGTDLATAGAGIDATTSGHLVLGAASAVTSRTAATLDLNATSILQMSETSDFIRNLPEHGWPPSTHVVSIAARADPVVPNHQTRLEQTNVSANTYDTVVSPHGRNTLLDHARLPGSPEATQEILRALNRQAPTCRTLEDAFADGVAGRQASYTADSIGTALALAGIYADYRTRQTIMSPFGRNRLR
ncbi:MAG TPA: peptidoglycan DD-metalloendopeptidase family protein [Acidimicrobiales bacterium]|nr:peptidoglycan DD-metalloendopeptidase family protein [Acidimicrobiales bacterium]